MKPFKVSADSVPFTYEGVVKMNTNGHDIIIVGGGLVGPLSALLMAKRGYRVHLYEYRGDPRQSKHTRGRSINLALSNRARRALRKVGLEEEILECGIPMKGRYIHNIEGKNQSILYDSRTRQCIYSVGRNFLNQKLLDELDKHPNICLYFNHKLINVDIEQGSLTFLQIKTNTQIEVTGNLVIGADGAFSTLRRAMQQTSLFNFSQTYIDHGYIEMCIASKAGRAMVPNHLHIWPRGEFMMIALPNLDVSWTVTLFMPFQRFRELDSPEKLLYFFKTVFPDAVKLIGEKQLLEDYFKIEPSALISIKCSKFHVGGNVLIIGDAAHAMVPFYGQGMNAGFEDCVLLDSILESCNNDIPLALRQFTEQRRDDAHAISDLAMYNYTEMRDLVTRPAYRARKAFDDFLFWMFPSLWIPLYNSVTFSRMSYKQCVTNRRLQDKIIHLFVGFVLVLVFFIIVYSFNIFGIK